MTESKSSKFWAIVTLILIAVIVIGGIFIWSRYSPNKPIEISIPQRQESEGRIYVSGAVMKTGSYPFTTKDSIGSVIAAAGNVTENATLDGVKLYVPQRGERQEPQKIDINRAEIWLLEALPEIGATLAQRIYDYRLQNGPFRNTRDITKVAGIDSSTYEKIKDLITVADQTD